MGGEREGCSSRKLKPKINDEFILRAYIYLYVYIHIIYIYIYSGFCMKLINVHLEYDLRCCSFYNKYSGMI